MSAYKIHEYIKTDVQYYIPNVEAYPCENHPTAPFQPQQIIQSLDRLYKAPKRFYKAPTDFTNPPERPYKGKHC